MDPQQLGALVKWLDQVGEEDDATRAEVERHLDNAEHYPNTFAALLHISVTRECGLAVRLGAILRVKNRVLHLISHALGLASATTSSGLTPEMAMLHITDIKQNVLRLVSEADADCLPDFFISHLATTVAYIAIHFWPGNWPELTPTIAQLIRSDNLVVMGRSLQVLKKVIKYAFVVYPVQTSPAHSTSGFLPSTPTTLSHGCADPRTALVDMCISIAPAAIEASSFYTKELWSKFEAIFPFLKSFTDLQQGISASSSSTLTSTSVDASSSQVDMEALTSLSLLTVRWVKLLRHAVCSGFPYDPNVREYCLREGKGWDDDNLAKSLPTQGREEALSIRDRTMNKVAAFQSFVGSLHNLAHLFDILIHAACLVTTDDTDSSSSVISTANQGNNANGSNSGNNKGLWGGASQGRLMKLPGVGYLVSFKKYAAKGGGESGGNARVTISDDVIMNIGKCYRNVCELLLALQASHPFLVQPMRPQHFTLFGSLLNKCIQQIPSPIFMPKTPVSPLLITLASSFPNWSFLPSIPTPSASANDEALDQTRQLISLALRYLTALISPRARHSPLTSSALSIHAPSSYTMSHPSSSAETEWLVDPATLNHLIHLIVFNFLSPTREDIYTFASSPIEYATSFLTDTTASSAPSSLPLASLSSSLSSSSSSYPIPTSLSSLRSLLAAVYGNPIDELTTRDYAAKLLKTILQAPLPQPLALPSLSTSSSYPHTLTHTMFSVGISTIISMVHAVTTDVSTLLSSPSLLQQLRESFTSSPPTHLSQTPLLLILTLKIGVYTALGLIADDVIQQTDLFAPYASSIPAILSAVASVTSSNPSSASFTSPFDFLSFFEAILSSELRSLIPTPDSPSQLHHTSDLLQSAVDPSSSSSLFSSQSSDDTYDDPVDLVSEAKAMLRHRIVWLIGRFSDAFVLTHLQPVSPPSSPVAGNPSTIPPSRSGHAQYDPQREQQRQRILSLLPSVLSALLSVITTDTHLSVRLEAVTALEQYCTHKHRQMYTEFSSFVPGCVSTLLSFCERIIIEHTSAKLDLSEHEAIAFLDNAAVGDDTGARTNSSSGGDGGGYFSELLGSSAAASTTHALEALTSVLATIKALVLSSSSETATSIALALTGQQSASSPSSTNQSAFTTLWVRCGADFSLIRGTLLGILNALVRTMGPSAHSSLSGHTTDQHSAQADHSVSTVVSWLTSVIRQCLRTTERPQSKEESKDASGNCAGSPLCDSLGNPFPFLSSYSDSSEHSTHRQALSLWSSLLDNVTAVPVSSSSSSSSSSPGTSSLSILDDLFVSQWLVSCLADDGDGMDSLLTILQRQVLLWEAEHSGNVPFLQDAIQTVMNASQTNSSSTQLGGETTSKGPGRGESEISSLSLLQVSKYWSVNPSDKTQANFKVLCDGLVVLATKFIVPQTIETSLRHQLAMSSQQQQQHQQQQQQDPTPASALTVPQSFHDTARSASLLSRSALLLLKLYLSTQDFHSVLASSSSSGGNVSQSPMLGSLASLISLLRLHSHTAASLFSSLYQSSSSSSSSSPSPTQLRQFIPLLEPAFDLFGFLYTISYATVSPSSSPASSSTPSSLPWSFDPTPLFTSSPALPTILSYPLFNLQRTHGLRLHHHQQANQHTSSPSTTSTQLSSLILATSPLSLLSSFYPNPPSIPSTPSSPSPFPLSLLPVLSHPTLFSYLPGHKQILMTTSSLALLFPPPSSPSSPQLISVLLGQLLENASKIRPEPRSRHSTTLQFVLLHQLYSYYSSTPLPLPPAFSSPGSMPALPRPFTWHWTQHIIDLKSGNLALLSLVPVTRQANPSPLPRAGGLVTDNSLLRQYLSSTLQRGSQTVNPDAINYAIQSMKNAQAILQFLNG